MLLTLGLSLATLLTTINASWIHIPRVLPRDNAAPAAPESTLSYTGLKGPLNWFGLDPKANEKCARGKNQSPINIEPSSSTVETLDKASRPRLNYPRVDSAEFKNPGNDVEVEVNGTLTFQGVEYNLTQFHFHTPSEHRLREEYFPMEMHLVHRRAVPLQDGTTPRLVLGVFFQLAAAGQPPDFIRNVFSHINEIAIPGTNTHTGVLDFASLAEHVAANEVYHYSGSLTTPPCSEGVTWLVSGQPLVLDVGSYNDAKRVIKFNSRYTQNEPGQENLLEHEAKLLRPYGPYARM